MTSFQGSTLHPIWNVIKDGHPFSEDYAPTITADQMEGAAWASLIKDARGLLMFNHSFGGAYQSQHVFFDCDPAIKTRFAAMTAKIRQLAPVLNSQSYQWSAGTTDVATMLKYVGGS